MHVARQISLRAWNERAIELAGSYWSQRGFLVSLDKSPRLLGTRGSRVGTLFPFYWGRERAGLLDVDWTKPEGTMTMTPVSERAVLVELDLALLGLPGRETDWATAFLRLEVAELHHIPGMRVTWPKSGHGSRTPSGGLPDDGCGRRDLRVDVCPMSGRMRSRNSRCAFFSLATPALIWDEPFG